uniref:Uncharacterized protein n=1 Tax=Anguilla anguilla TaxID=7936 RepID=A0A0E9UFC3_ANGAN
MSLCCLRQTNGFIRYIANHSQPRGLAHVSIDGIVVPFPKKRVH